jgi:hypothetical protein
MTNFDICAIEMNSMPHQSPIISHQPLAVALRDGIAQLERESVPSAARGSMHILNRKSTRLRVSNIFL